MNDTPDELSTRLTTRYRARTPAERVRMAAAMFGVATTLARAGILARSGRIADSEVRLQLLRRLYGGELTETQLEQIAEWKRSPG